MKIKPQVVVVGLGRFGTSFASKMYQLGYDVMAIDKDEDIPASHGIKYPLIVKPNDQGSTIGLTIVKNDKELAADVLYNAAESLRISTVMLSPVMPEKCKEILNALGSTSSSLEWGSLKPGEKIPETNPIFPRIVE